jgi:phosphohistidine phosphatase
MKSLLILRHAKSDWSNPELSDYNRPLAKRGLKDAPRMGRLLAGYNSMPDIIVSSPSLRTKQTVEYSVLANGYAGEIIWDERLYGGTPFDYLAAVRELPTTVQLPMLVGHNPGIEETISLLLSLTGESLQGGNRLRVPTAGLARLDAGIDRWEEIKPGVCVLRWFVIPKLLRVLDA